MVNQENRLTAVGLGRTKNQTFSAGNGRLRTLHSSKAKVSDTVTSSEDSMEICIHNEYCIAGKVLGDLQTNTNQFQYDLKRVLGKDSDPDPAPQPHPSASKETSTDTTKANTSG